MKLQAIQSELKAPKNQYNSFGHYKYRSCEDILEALKPILKEHNCALIVSDEVVMLGSRFYVKATVILKTGDQEEGDYSVSAYAREADNKKGMDEAQFNSFKKQLRAALRWEGVSYPMVSRKDAVRAIVRCALGTASDMCIIPVQDILGLDNSARMNMPSSPSGNWQFRLAESDNLAIRQEMADFGIYNTIVQTEHFRLLRSGREHLHIRLMRLWL